MFSKRSVKKYWLLFFLFSFVISSNSFSTSVTVNGVNVIASDDVKDAVQFDSYWRFSIGDNLDWARADFDHSKWDSVFLPITLEEFFEYKYKGNLWLRSTINVSKEELNKSYVLLIEQYGASEIYIDGKLIHSIGKVGNTASNEKFFNPKNAPFNIRFDSIGKHVIAIRFSNHAFLSTDDDEAYLEAFNLNIVEPETALLINKFRNLKGSVLYSMAAGLFLTLSVLNFILFLFYKRDKTNLYYSIFSVSLAATFIVHVIDHYGARAETAVFTDRVFYLASFITDVALLALVYSFIYEKWPKRFWIVSALCLIGSILIIPEFDIAKTVNGILSIYCIIDVTVLAIKAYFKKYDPTKKKRKRILIILGSLILLAFLGHYIHTLISVIAGVLIVLILVLPIAGSIFIVPIYMTIHQARNFAIINKSLEEQLIQVKELSAKTIEQEQEKKRILESQNEMLEQQVEERTLELAQKNIEITDSINYAQRIQKAILTSKEEISEKLNDFFILFKPKDIVSGDFYFYTHKDNTVLIAAADCTGHGVPGALMSMIGSEKLMGAALESSEPSFILNAINRGIKSSLRQSDKDESTKDGMDIALVAINLDTLKLNYSGANRPIWIVRNNTNAVEEIKATKKAIAGFTSDDQVFEQHEISFNKGDTFYLFTDGYADQFGSSGKKLMTKKFREILLEMQHLPMQEQETFLNTFIENWKTGVEQVDDILVIGVRL